MPASQEPLVRMLEALERLLKPRPAWVKLGFALQEAFGPPADAGMSELLWPFQYSLTWIDSKARETGGEFVPRYGGYPPALSSVASEVTDAWSEVVRRLPDPILESRIRDLLWVRRVQPRPDEHCRLAVKAYRKLQGEPWEPMYKCEAMTRALELAAHLKDGELRREIGEECLGATRRALARDPYPGPLMMLLRALVKYRASEEREALEEALKAAATKYAGNPDVFENVKDLEVSVLGRTPERHRAVQRQKSEAWKAHALRSTGLARLSFLERALERARDGGLTPESDDLLRMIQAIPKDELGLTRFEATERVPGEVIRALEQEVLGGSTWQEGLHRWGRVGPPSGDPSTNRSLVERLRAEAPLSAMLNRDILGAHNSQLRKSETEEDRIEFDLIGVEVMNISLCAALFPGVLARIFSGGEPPLDELTTYFTSPLIAAPVAERLGKALLLFLREEYDEALHVAVPRVEAVVRELASQAGGVVIRESRGPKAGGVTGLADMLRELEGKMDEGWRRYLRALLSEPLGLNLRNNIAHGLLVKGDAASAAMVLHVACFLKSCTVTVAPPAVEASGGA